MEKREEYIKKALNADTDLSEEEYRAKCEKADEITKKNDIKGKAPISEAVRHKRIQTNFYGTSLNVGLSQLAELNRIGDALQEIYYLIFVSLTDEQKEKYIKMQEKKDRS